MIRCALTALALALTLVGAVQAETRGPASIPVPMTDAERAVFAASVGKCWNFAALPPDAQTVSVTLAVTIDAARRPVADSIRLINHSPTAASGPELTLAYEAARRAILRCGNSGLDLPPKKAAYWSKAEMTFSGGVLR